MTGGGKLKKRKKGKESRKKKKNVTKSFKTKKDCILG
jgi:hypothetical protein